MSNALAIATVTQALALLIENSLRPEIDMQVSVKTQRPPAEAPDDPTITVFLYQVTPNAARGANDLPTRAADGTLLRRPAAALDLHFLISAYGEESELVGQRLIGCVVRALHEVPVLPKALIEEAVERPHLAGSDLAGAVDRVRFTPTRMDIDETSKLWGMLHQTPYALSVVYQAALVLVDGRERPAPAEPVRRLTVGAAPFGAPGAPERPGRPLGDPDRAGTGAEAAPSAEPRPAADTSKPSPSASAGSSGGSAAKAATGTAPKSGGRSTARAGAAKRTSAKPATASTRRRRSGATPPAARKTGDPSPRTPGKSGGHSGDEGS
ncbi:DUF4255 domain-containing protein [Streptomyces sp. TP-A0874]|uniref:DUF4255 domain-containing protein n=1 Tax=Streptomyces sp. TP-A0874 TaxID=549819 RepID=UPI000853D3C7|nr:DUF4255 domain-containing protein [Streptomyces sp. TP-A0874]